MISAHGVNPFFFNKKKLDAQNTTPSLPHPLLHSITSHFYLTPLPCPPSKWMSYVYHPYIYNRNGWWNFNFFAGIKWVVFPSKTMGKNHKDFLRNLKQICVKLHGINWKIFRLASWKQSELDVKMKRKTGSSLWISAWYWLWCTESIPL